MSLEGSITSLGRINSNLKAMNNALYSLLLLTFRFLILPKVMEAANHMRTVVQNLSNITRKSKLG